MAIPTKRLDGLDPTVNPQRDHEVAAMRDSTSNRLRVEQILALLQSSDIPNAAVTLAKLAADARAAASHTFDDTIAQLGETDVQGAIEASVLRGKMLGEPFFLFDNITGVSAPDNSGAAKYIRLTAGQSGAGGYNEGLLINESVSGSAPLVEADAEIAVGPMAGQRVPLINTEMSFIRPGTSSGTLQFDQMQGHWHLVRDDADDPVGIHESSGAAGTGNRARRSSIDNGPYLARAIIEGTHGAPRVGVETRSKNRQATYYMRIV